MRSTQRTGFISLLRIISAFAVVVIHVIASGIGNNVGTVPSSTQSRLLLIETLMRWSVPVFFMITGYIFLGVKRECTFASIRKYIIRFLAVLFTVGWLFALMERVFDAGSLQPTLVLLALRDVFLGNLWDHMWYLYAIAGLYLLLPILKPFVDARPENLPALCVLTFLSGIIIPTLNDIFGVEIAIDFLLVSRHAFYVLFGAWVSKWKITPPPTGLRACCVGGIIASALAIAHFKLARGWEFASSYSSPTIAILSCCIFVLFAATFCNYREGKLASLLSSCTWGIYIFHPLFLNLAIKVLHFYPLHYNPLLSIPLSCAGIFAVSAVFAYLLKRIPIVRRWF